MSFLSLHHIKVPNVANNDAEDNNAKHSNLFMVILYLVTSCPVEILLNNEEQNLNQASYTVGDLRWRYGEFYCSFRESGFLRVFVMKAFSLEELMAIFASIPHCQHSKGYIFVWSRFEFSWEKLDSGEESLSSFLQALQLLANLSLPVYIFRRSRTGMSV